MDILKPRLKPGLFQRGRDVFGQVFGEKPHSHNLHGYGSLVFPETGHCRIKKYKGGTPLY